MVLFAHFEEDKMHIVLKALDLILEIRALKEMQTFNLLPVWNSGQAFRLPHLCFCRQRG